MRITAQPNTSPVHIINKIAESKDKEITLFLPEDSVFFADIENFKLLKRQAELAGKVIRIVTPDVSARNKARQFGFQAVSPQKDSSFFASLEQALGQVGEAPTTSKEPSTPASPEHFTPSGKNASEQKFYRRWLKWLVLGAAVIGALVWAIVFLPFAQVTVFSQRETVEFTLSAELVQALSQVNIDEKKLPAQLIEVQKKVSFVSESTGFKDFNQKAQGQIVVYNQQPFEQPMIPSRFQAENGNIYWSQRNILIPPRHTEDGKVVPGTLKVEVVADQPGSEYNLECSEEKPCRFTIPAWKGTDKFDKVYAVATTPLLGGETGESKVVTESDLKVARNVIKEKARKEAETALKSSTPQGFQFLVDSMDFKVSDISFDRSAGDIGDNFTTSANLEARAFIVSKEAIRDFVDALVKARIEPNQRTFPDSIEVNFSTVSVDLEKGTAKVNLAVKEDVGWAIDQEALKKKLAGRSLPQARQILLNEDKIDSAQIRLGPRGAFWVNSIPSRLSQIRIEVR